MLKQKLVRYVFIGAVVFSFLGCETSSTTDNKVVEEAGVDTVNFKIVKPDETHYEGKITYSDMEKIDFNFLKEVIGSFSTGEFNVQFALNGPLSVLSTDEKEIEIFNAKELLEASGYTVVKSTDEDAGDAGEDAGDAGEDAGEDAGDAGEDAGDAVVAKSNVKVTGQEISALDFDDAYYAKKGLGLDRDTYEKVTDTILNDTATNLHWVATGKKLTVAKAKKECESLSSLSKDDWRLPTILELATLVNFRSFPAVDNEVQPILFAKDANVKVWASENSGSEEYYYFVDYKTGLIASQVNSDYVDVLCVSGDEINKNHVFKKNDGYVLDEERKLMWEDGSHVRTSITWEEGLAYCEALDLEGYADWRVANMSEIFTILDYTKTTYQIGEFSVASRAMWSSTSLSSHIDDNAYTAVESYGNTQSKNKSLTKRAVRCVRTVR